MSGFRTSPNRAFPSWPNKFVSQISVFSAAQLNPIRIFAHRQIDVGFDGGGCKECKRGFRGFGVEDEVRGCVGCEEVS